MSWNYRLILTHTNDPNLSGIDQPPEDGENFIEIHEVYYDESGTPNSCTAKGVTICGETLAELVDVYDMMKLAFEKPVLEMTDFVREPEKDI